MSDSDLTVSILREIRDEIRTTNGKLDATNSKLDTTKSELKAELAATRIELKAEIAITNSRLDVVETTLTEVAGQLLMIERFIKNSTERTEQSVEDLRERVVRLETRLDER